MRLFSFSFTKEILEEVVRELHKVKDEIIDGENSRILYLNIHRATFVQRYEHGLYTFLVSLAIRRELTRMGTT